MPFYLMHELTHAALSPYRAVADATKLYFQNPLNPVSLTNAGKSIAAACEVFERTTRQYGKPSFGLNTTEIDGHTLSVEEKVVWSRTFCDLLHFERYLPARADVKMTGRTSNVVLVAPMSGHYATLLRGTVEALLPEHEVFITDWKDARQIPLSEGSFDLDDYIDYIVGISEHFDGDVHFVAVCQPSVPVLAAIAHMEETGHPATPKSMTLMGGPIDTRINPTAVNDLAHSRDLNWFENNVIMRVPFPHTGVMRQVYPGFLQLSGFMSMNLDRHMNAHREFYNHLVEGDGDSAEKHREFYDEYLAVMDLTAEFYLQTVDSVFVRHALPNGTLMHRGVKVQPEKIKRTALFTVEGEKDDISGVGQTKAAHALCANLGDEKRAHYEQPGVGHYGVFNGSRFRREIAPRITKFVREHDGAVETATKTTAAKRTQPRPTKTKVEAKAKPATIPQKDDLKLIKGVGPKLEETLNAAGIISFNQIALLKAAEIRSLEEKIGFPGRVARDAWKQQAKQLMKDRAA